MIYKYKCVNKECVDYGVELTINKPMKDCNKKEYCELCRKELQRVFSLGGLRTFGDGYKS